MDFSAAADRNIRWFILFRVVFNARFYYPVMAILFLDLGLTLDQYALLNVAWAASIVLLEVPSGAMADLIGRKRLIVFGSALMVLEMAIFAFVPTASVTLLFWVFLLNRVVSGAAEAAVSGADEALAYDALKQAGRDHEWPAVLSRLARWQSTGFFFAMILGSAIYDPALVNRVFSWLGIHARVVASDTVRLPVYLTFASSLVTLWAALRLQEPPLPSSRRTSAGAALGEVLASGRWILATPLALFVILATVCNDSFIRLFLTIGTQYYRLIGLPEASFGIIGSTFALLGYLAPPLARRLIASNSPALTFAAISIATVIGLAGLGLLWPIAGLLFPLILGLAMSVMNFSTSHYLNQVAEPARRATILSFRGLTINLAYGGVGLLFAALIGSLRRQDPTLTEDAVFSAALPWLPWCFALIAGALFAWQKFRGPLSLADSSKQNPGAAP